MPYAFTRRTDGTGQTIFAAHVNELQVAAENNARRSATLIVAASNASQLSKDSADYVCDGTADQAEINTAITALAGANGGVVELTEGLFTTNAAISINSSVSITLRGRGRNATTLRLANAANVNMIAFAVRGTTGSGEQTTTTNFTLLDLKMDGNKAQQGAGPYHGVYAFAARFCTFQRIWFTDIKGYAIKFDGDQNVGLTHFGWWNRVVDNYFLTCAGAIQENSSEASYFLNNTFTEFDAGFWGMQLGSGGHSIMGNVFGSGLGSHDREIIEFQNSLTSKLIGNRFDQARRQLVKVSAGNQIIANNEFLDAGLATTNTYAALQFGTTATDGSIVSNNLFKQSQGTNVSNFVYEESGIAHANTYVGNRFASTAGTANVSIPAASVSKFSTNFGWVTENSGTATVSAATSVAVTHGLATTPTRVNVTPTTDPGSGIRWWISAKGATTFTITLSASATVSFDWRASVG